MATTNITAICNRINSICVNAEDTWSGRAKLVNDLARIKNELDQIMVPILREIDSLKLRIDLLREFGFDAQISEHQNKLEELERAFQEYEKIEIKVLDIIKKYN